MDLHLLPEPKEGWENYAIGMFVTWEVPRLRKKDSSEQPDKYELTIEEVDMLIRNTLMFQPKNCLI